MSKTRSLRITPAKQVVMKFKDEPNSKVKSQIKEESRERST
jgi:hypothetical protein